MRVLEVRNVHEALPKAIALLKEHGIRRDSRNGPVLVAPWPVTTVYANPCERVLFWPERDANPFFHAYESMWMLAGRNDVAGPAWYAKNMLNYSDDGITLHGAYGYRWRQWFQRDQLSVIASRLQKDPDDRRCILQMWDTVQDLGSLSRDIPCNTIATFQRDAAGALDLTVFCRSNDILWGAYGANAVHLSFLLEYMALWIGCPVGKYTQVSVNWHAYLDTLAPLENLTSTGDNPYDHIQYAPLFHGTEIKELDARIADLLMQADNGLPSQFNDDEPFFHAALLLLRAHEAWRMIKNEKRYTNALAILAPSDSRNDWLTAAREWVQRRYTTWQMKQVLAGDASHQ